MIAGSVKTAGKFISASIKVYVVDEYKRTKVLLADTISTPLAAEYDKELTVS